MNKTQFVHYVAKENNVKINEVDKALDLILNGMLQAVEDGNEINILGFMKVQVKDRKEHKGRNPQTGEEIMIPASKKVVAKMGKLFQDKVN
jgi:DNA-binding protein HU-beta